MIMQSKKQDICLTVNMKALGSFETSGTTYPTAERCIPEDSNLQCKSTYTNSRGYEGSLVEALRYEPAGRGFESLWSNYGFSLTNPSGPTTALESIQLLTETSTTYFLKGKGGRCVGLTTLLPPYANCIGIV
jgi:hypothetical protein